METQDSSEGRTSDPASLSVAQNSPERKKKKTLDINMEETN